MPNASRSWEFAESADLSSLRLLTLALGRDVTTLPPTALPRTLASSLGRAWSGLEADLLQIPRGKAEVPGGDLHIVGMHIGPPINAVSRAGDQRASGVQKPGDIDIIPAGVDGTWEDEADCQLLRLALHQSLLTQVAEELGRDSSIFELVPRLQLRDAGIEAIMWAIKAELESDTPSHPLFVDHLANALAIRLVETTTRPIAPTERLRSKGLSPRQLSTLIEFIEGNLDQRLHLADLAAVAGVSITRLKLHFRSSMGTPVHQYVIQRRIERARMLITTTSMPASEIALAAGFAHQSHMSSTMLRIIGLSPSQLTRRK